MRRRRQGGEADSLAFLDIITCGFGAIVLLLIITKPVPNETDFSEQQRDLGAVIMSIAQNVAALQFQLQSLKSELIAIPNPVEQTVDQTLEQTIAATKQSLHELKSSNEALELVKKTQNRTSITQSTAPEKRDPEVGGIPVDSNYVIFVIDTSGSMQQIWDSVIDVVNRVIDIHPKVLGFQVMNDNGNYLFETTKRKWLPDTPRSRENVKDAMKHWTSFSSSSPVEGIETAIRTYAGKKENIAIYVFGDEFSGSSYDAVVDAVHRLNINLTTGQPRMRVHSIGFLTEFSGSERFSVLMRNVVERNRGAFLGLPQ